MTLLIVVNVKASGFITVYSKCSRTEPHGEIKCLGLHQKHFFLASLFKYEEEEDFFFFFKIFKFSS